MQYNGMEPMRAPDQVAGTLSSDVINDLNAHNEDVPSDHEIGNDSGSRESVASATPPPPSEVPSSANAAECSSNQVDNLPDVDGKGAWLRIICARRQGLM